MLKITNHYTIRFLKCIHLLATILWCGGTFVTILLHYTVGLPSDIETILHLYLIRPGIWTLIATGFIYTLFTNFTCKLHWVRAKWIITMTTALSGVIIASAPWADATKLVLMMALIVVSVYHIPKNKTTVKI